MERKLQFWMFLINFANQNYLLVVKRQLNLWRINQKEKKTFQKMRMLLVPHILVPVQAPLMGFLMVKAVVDAEILWVLGVISNNYSQNSWRNKSELFAGMFKDTNIAQSFSCGSTKCGYIVNFGLAPFFKSPLAEALNDASHYACGFGESYNSVIKKRQMDIHVWY